MTAPPTRPSHTDAYEVDNGKLVSLSEDEPSQLAVLIHAQFRGTILSSAFPCLGGASAIRRSHYWFAVYQSLGSEAAVRSCAADLREFVKARPASQFPVFAFVTAYDGPVGISEAQFERDLWRHLNALRASDSGGHLPEIELIDAEDPGFVYARREFFVVGLNPASSRCARRFGWPVLVFNALSHSALLRRTGKHERMRERILARDRRLQGEGNPSLEAPQLAQFSGRAVGLDWQCPHGSG